MFRSFVATHSYATWLIRMRQDAFICDMSYQTASTFRGVGGGLKNFKKKPARAGLPRRLALVRATPRAEIDVIGVQQC